MIDPEVARLRRLRTEALLVREIARTFESSRWAANESLLDRSACASWRVARVISGRLKGHPYADYQRDAGVASRARNRVHAYFLALTNKDRVRALKALEARVDGLGHQLDDAIALAWSSDFSAALSRSQSEIRMLGAALAEEACSREVPERAVQGPSRPEQVVDNLGSLEGDWPYLAF
jgi:hypothetical protein